MAIVVEGDPTPDDLGAYLGLENIDTSRAALMLRLARERLEMYANPLPATANGLVLSVAGRAYTNVSSARQAGIGSAQVSFGSPNSNFGVGGLYVSKSEIRDLRRLAGRTGAFQVDMLAVDADGDGVVDPPAVV